MILALLFLVGFASATDSGLPNEPDQTRVKLQKIAAGNEMQLNFQLALPQTQELNKGAPSFVAVYEKQKGSSEWQETSKIDLNKMFHIGNGLEFSKLIQLKSPDSEIAVHATIFHCGADHKTACFIQGFQGVTSRAPGSAHAIPFHIKGVMR